jgi:hypothetical protein
VPALEIPADARLPIGITPQWLAAAAAAEWQCACATPGARHVCSRSHVTDADGRCVRRATGPLAVRLILATDSDGALRLMCEPCAANHARVIARATAAAQTESHHAQASLF